MRSLWGIVLFQISITILALYGLSRAYREIYPNSGTRSSNLRDTALMTLNTLKSTAADAGSRATRGGLQGGAAWGIVEFIEAFNIYDFTERQSNITIIVLTALVSYGQNLVENRIGKGLLRTVAHPVQTDNGPRDEDPPQRNVNQDPDFIPAGAEDVVDEVDEKA